MLNHILNSRARTITSAAFILAVSSLLSRILGLLRDRLLTNRFGAGEELDIYFAAFRIPDLVYNILIVGGIAVAFLPIFSGYFKKSETNPEKEFLSAGREERWPEEAIKFTNNLLNCFFFLLVVLCLVLAVFTPFIINFIVPGFSPANKTVTANLTRIMFLSPILFGISSIFSGILQYFERFLVYSLAPLLYNLGIIFGILFFVPLFGIYGLGYSVIFGALLYFLIQAPAVKMLGFKYKFLLNFKHIGIKKVFKMMGPRIFGVAVDNINLVVITAIASVLAAGSITIFTLSNNLQYFPVGIIGISFAISSFPVFSRYMANGQKKEFISHFSSVFRQIIFLTVPIAFLIFLERAQIVRLVYGTGKFDWVDTRLTAAALGIFCFGILTNSLIPLVARAFFSFQNTKTPVIIGIISVILNISFSLFFIFLLRYNYYFYNFWAGLLKLSDIKNIEVIALPFSFVLVSFFQLFLLLLWLYKKIGDYGIKEIFHSFKNILFYSLFLAVSTYFSLHLASLFVDMRTFWGVFSQASFAALAGTLFYILTSYFLKSEELKIIFSSVLKRIKLFF
jgi:putative peptidoglycan lipid II flippase